MRVPPLSALQNNPQVMSYCGFKYEFFSHFYPAMNPCRNNWIGKWNLPHLPCRPNHLRPVLIPGSSGNFIGPAPASSDRSSTDCGGGNNSESTMDKIMERLKRVGYRDDENATKGTMTKKMMDKGYIEDMFYVEEEMPPNSRGGFSGSSLGVDNVIENDGKARFPWEKPKDQAWGEPVRTRKKTFLADLTLPMPMLRRLRFLGFNTSSKTKIGNSGVTQEVVEAIHEKWKKSEIVRLKYEGTSSLNMKRMHEILERKTGGMVIWRSGTSIILYRGSSYEVPPIEQDEQSHNQNGNPYRSSPEAADITNSRFSEQSSISDVKTPQKNQNHVAEDNNEEESVVLEARYDDEIDNLLDGLGPRYTDWPGDGPLPVDADLLPATVPGFQPPFRVLPHGVRYNVGLKEATALRRLSKTLPPHFAIGRSRQLQGLAVAMIKLWEKSLIAKVALKRNVHLTASERMTENIKKLTGGVLLSRNKDFFLFHRGKNFLANDVAEALLERQTLAKNFQDVEEEVRLRASALVEPNYEVANQPVTAGSLGETLDANAWWGKRLDDDHEKNMKKEVEIDRHAKLVRILEGRLAFAERKLERAGHALAKVEESLKPTQQQADPASITDEERFMFRKIGRKMKAFLLLGRRGVFDGTVENMHLHWKYRELVKIILKAKNFEIVRKIALSLEAESGGVLVSVEKVSKGYAILVYRGRDYQPPSTIRPKNLLTKRKALAQSIELQRRESLNKHIFTLQRRVGKLRAELEQMDTVKDQGDEQLYNRLDSAYATDDEESEKEDDISYLEAYGDGSEQEDGSDDLIQNLDECEDGNGDELIQNLNECEDETNDSIHYSLHETTSPLH